MCGLYSLGLSTNYWTGPWPTGYGFWLETGGFLVRVPAVDFWLIALDKLLTSTCLC